VNYVLTPQAETELLEAATFYAQNVSMAVAENFLATFEQKARLIRRVSWNRNAKRQPSSPVSHRQGPGGRLDACQEPP
jgi:hypothetical protein